MLTKHKELPGLFIIAMENFTKTSVSRTKKTVAVGILAMRSLMATSIIAFSIFPGFWRMLAMVRQKIQKRSFYILSAWMTEISCCFVAEGQIMPRYKNNNICQACYLVESSQLMELAGVPRWSPVAPVPASVPAGCGKYAFARPQCLAWDYCGLLSVDPYPAPSYEFCRSAILTG